MGSTSLCLCSGAPLTGSKYVVGSFKLFETPRRQNVRPTAHQSGGQAVPHVQRQEGHGGTPEAETAG